MIGDTGVVERLPVREMKDRLDAKRRVVRLQAEVSGFRRVQPTDLHVHVGEADRDAERALDIIEDRVGNDLPVQIRDDLLHVIRLLVTKHLAIDEADPFDVIDVVRHVDPEVLRNCLVRFCDRDVEHVRRQDAVAEIALEPLRREQAHVARAVMTPDEDAAPAKLEDYPTPFEQFERFRHRALTDGILAHQLFEHGKFIALFQIMLIDVLFDLCCNLLVF